MKKSTMMSMPTNKKKNEVDLNSCQKAGEYTTFCLNCNIREYL